VKNKLIGADWIVPVEGDIIKDGVVAIDGNRIAWIGAKIDLPDGLNASEIKWINGVMLPGLVNAHTHLQYSNLQHIGQGSYRDFEHWSEDFEVAYDAVTDPRDWADAATTGARMALETGTTVFSEIVTDDAARGAISNCCASGVEYLEVIGELDKNWAATGRKTFLDRLSMSCDTNVGISPHAPYSVDPEVIKDLVSIASNKDIRVHTHLAESSVEDALYVDGNHTVLEIYGCLRDQFKLVREGGAGQKAADFADSLGLLTPTCHVAHGIYLDRAGRDLLLERGTRVALCPRSNATIGLAEAPIAAYLKEGHDICIGTDSLSSCPSLDLMADVRLAADIARRQGYESADLFTRMITAATIAGARALGLDVNGYGSLQKGGPADLAVFAVPIENEQVEQSLIENGEGNCVLTIAGGKVVYDVAS